MENNDNNNNLWKLLWNYDPNGLIVVDAENMKIKLVNRAFCQMFKLAESEIIGQKASRILSDIEDLQQVWEKNEVIRGKEKEYPRYNLYVRKVIFSIKEEKVIACIMVDLTEEMARKKEMKEVKEETIKQVNEVVENQMKVVQEIASLLGETTAETKISLLKILKMLEQETI